MLASMRLTGLVVDWGGVLTNGLHEAIEAWTVAEGIDLGAYVDAMRSFGPDAVDEMVINPVHALERGELAVPHFEETFSELLEQRLGHPVRREGLVGRMLAHFEHAPDMAALVNRAKAAGIKTALLSNSWGHHYPDEFFEGMFDATVISGEVGLRKPDPEIFELVLARLGLAAGECVFVDDLRTNVDAAVALGFVGVWHQSYEQCAAELEVLLNLPGLAGT